MDLFYKEAKEIYFVYIGVSLNMTIENENIQEKIIELKNVTMKFNMSEEIVDTLKEYIVRLIKGQLFYKEFIALHNVTFDIYKGDILGIVGFNGAGKSTLLKILAGVIEPAEGDVFVKGTVAPLIELGAGFDPELTAYENIYLNGAMLGYSKNEIDLRLDDIVEFAELRDFLNIPIKNFSSGMYARLGFSIATIFVPDVLIVDEILGVGDFHFQEKCKNRIKEMIANGVTIILVSHDINQIESLCNKVLWLEKGNVKKFGNACCVCEEYKKA